MYNSYPLPWWQIVFLRGEWLLLNASSAIFQQQIPILVSLVWPHRGSNPRSTVLEACTLTITPLMWSSFLELTLTYTLLSTSNIEVFSIAVLLTGNYTLLSTSNIGVFSIAVLLTVTYTLLRTSNIGVFSIAVLLTVTYTLLSTSNIGVFSIAVLLITVRNCIHDADSCNGLDKSIMNWKGKCFCKWFFFSNNFEWVIVV